MNRIKEVLEEKGIKQTWLAEKLGKSFSIVNAYVCNLRYSEEFNMKGEESKELSLHLANSITKFS